MTEHRDAARRARPSSCAVAVAGQRLQAVPAAVPVPRDRPAARAAVDGAAARVGGARRAGAALRPARRPARPETAMTLVDPAWDQVIAAQPDLAGELDPSSEPSCSTRPVRCCRATTGSRTRPGSTRRAANSAWRSSSPTAPAARLHRPDRRRTDWRVEGRRLQDRQGAAGGAGAGRVQGDVPDEVLCGGAAALARCAARRGCGCCTWPTARCWTTPPIVDELLRFEKTLMAIWRAIQSAGADRRFPAQPVAAVRLVRPPRALPSIRWHAAAVPRLAAGSRRGLCLRR